MTIKTVVMLAVVVGTVIWHSNKPATPKPQFLPTVEKDAVTFHCEGKVHCSQMTSCQEATFYLKNCPGTQMDGDGDGVPCESQFCER